MFHILQKLTLPFSVALCAALPVFADDDKTATICAEAEERYVELTGTPSAEAEGVIVVKMYKYNFCPAELVVPVGTTVRWVNVDKRTSHSVIVPNEPESDRAFPEEAIEFTFLTEGDQEYLCGPHWETQKMIGMITVAGK
ncbi:plastocyanin/azurin family copper-binding protein [Aliiroseovarius sp. F20344]|uniref:cupredoxin domain-containing protein n=1 Tax=Aliiroseovarius sp. F20344 TaxID=2926414 RepID=UPI001FF259D8|nr:plastocyanin/azurin family copper-binding protein [Aliiroseovarius sp. F20344]MCK0143906.1 copper-binding protein [Aliiroseovarius sp. F20344]